jgi:hypothetical protein
VELSENQLHGHMRNLLLEKQKTILDLFPKDGEPNFSYFTFLQNKGLQLPWDERH